MDQHRERWWIGLTVAGIFVACVCAAMGIVGVRWLAQVSRTPQPIPARAVTDRIAYVGTDGNIYTIAPDGSHKQAVTGDQPASADQYNALAWSSDGQLAFVSSTDKGSALFTSKPDGSDRVQVFSGGPNVTPFYLYWSPDGQRITFLTPSPTDTLALQIAGSHDADSSQTIAYGSPSYFSWAPDSQSLLMHIGGAQQNSTDARVAVFNPNRTDLTELPDKPGNFEAPAWSPDGQRFLLVRQASDQTDELVLAQGDDRRVLASSRTGLAFAWSPSGDHIAFSVPDPRIDFLYNAVTVIDPEGKERRVAAQGPIGAFFWSPDGKRLAVLNFDTSQPRPEGHVIPARMQTAPGLQSDLRLAWSVANIADGTSVDFPSFVPTASFLQLIPYFDQYAQSLSLWSPDGRYLLFADMNESGQPSIRVLDTTQPNQPARQLSEGSFAAWSWH
jgi:Tol biopolymer transport system component